MEGRLMQPPPAGTTGLTYADLARFPEGDRNRYELIDGELLVTPAPVKRHQLAVANIVHAFVGYTREHGGQVLPAPTDVRATDETLLEPDVVLIVASEVDPDEDRFVRGAPSLVVEVSSPSTRHTDLVGKRRVYEPPMLLDAVRFPGFTMPVPDALGRRPGPA
ncbi:MAG: Uma2 family endonuclease [Actinobacteria bacterium]|nr:Uma2 family endonuclease [Actinomycetota bacterium]